MVDVNVLIADLVSEVTPGARTRGVTFEALAFVSELNGHPRLLRQLLLGVIDQAMSRAPDGTCVTLVISPRSGHVEFQVANERPGLPLAIQRTAFAPDAAAPRERRFDLTDCQLAVEAQGGYLWISETASGTVVSVSLPNAAATSRYEAARTKSGMYLRAGQVGRAATAQTILVVEDEPLVRAFLARALRERGYGVIEADCAEGAMDHLMVKQQPLALLLSDVGLPGASGADLARQAKLINPSLPTLLMSATPKQSLVWDGVIREGTDLLQKPFSITDLFAKLDRLMPQPSSATTRAR